MNIFRRYQLSRDRRVTVANLVDELVRRKGNCKVSVGQGGTFHLADLHADVRSIDAFLRSSVALGPGQPVAIYAATTGNAFIGFWPSFAPAASRFR